MADSNNKDTKVNTAFMFGVTSDELTPDQSNHVSEIAKEFCLEMAQKYTNGQHEHGGNLWELTEDELIANAIAETLDQFVYLTTLRRVRRATAAAK